MFQVDPAKEKYVITKEVETMMDIERLKDIADEIEPRLPTHMDLGGSNLALEIRQLKEDFREVLRVLIEGAPPAKGKKKKKS